MISFSQCKDNFRQIFRLMIGTSMYVDVNYQGRAYRISVEDLHQPAKRIRHMKRRTLVDQIDTGRCEFCNRLTINGVCQNPVGSGHP